MENNKTSSTEEKPKEEGVKVEFVKLVDSTLFGFQNFKDGSIGIWWADSEKKRGIGIAVDAPDLAQTMSVAFQKIAQELSKKKSIIIPSGGKVVIPKPKITINR